MALSFDDANDAGENFEVLLCVLLVLPAALALFFSSPLFMTLAKMVVEKLQKTWGSGPQKRRVVPEATSRTKDCVKAPRCDDPSARQVR